VIRDDTGIGATIYGGMGNDTIYAGRGHDTVYGGQGDDTIYGERGSDTIYGGSGNNFIDGGPGANAISYGSATRYRGNSGLEAEIVQLVNGYRAAYGLAPLSINAQLNAAADMHTLDMAAMSNVYGPWTAMKHTLYGTSRPQISDRLDAAGYDNWTYSFRYGENIAFGYPTAAAVVEAWMNSPSHRDNILNPAFTETGVSVRTDAAGRLWFTQDFGYLG
jgi:uncharacterized protein YkwD